MKHRENILKLRNEGKSYRQIQEILACSKGTIAYHLGSGQKEKTHKRTRDLRSANTKKLRELKENIGCVDCKEMYPHYVLEFDHLPQYEKLGIVTNIARRYSWEKALEEVKKCDIVCANCHNIRTWNRQQG
jgi:transposase